MKKVVLFSSVAMLVVLLAIGSFASSGSSNTVAYAQEGTAVAGDTQSGPAVQTTQQDDDDNDFPWGLLGLLGLGGLAGLRRREEPTRVVEKSSGVRTYDSKK
jgi:MYXO-CTERM domain-containing protein